MSDPVSLAALSSVAIGGAVKFLFDQAGVLLTRWRERRDDKAVDQPATEPVAVVDDAVLAGTLVDPQIHFDVLESVEPELRAARRMLADLADGTDVLDSSDLQTIAQIDALRRLIEAVLQQRITFDGESRTASGPVVEGTIVADEVNAFAAAVRVKDIISGKVTGVTRVGRATGEVYGVVADNIGEKRPGCDDDTNP
jgi:hypothetical protein